MSGNPTILAGPSTTTDFQPSLALATPHATARSVTSFLPDAVSNASEGRYWAEKFGLGGDPAKNRLFAHPRKVILQASAASVIHLLTFGPVTLKASPLAVVGGPRVQLYGTSAHSTFHRTLSSKSSLSAAESSNITCDRQIQTGGSLALAAVYRSDGRLLAVATEYGQVRIADTSTRAILCTFAVPNKLPIRSLAWLRDGQHVLSGGDDGAVRLWSLARDSMANSSAATSSKVLTGHGDAVRSVATWEASIRTRNKFPHNALAFTASYDKTIRVWNMDNALLTSDKQAAAAETQQDLCLAVLNHGDPVEAILVMYATGDAGVPCWLISAGGTKIKVWNVLSGACVQEVDARHRKTITSILAIARRNAESDTAMQMRVFTGSLDGLLRVHSWDSNTGTLRHLHGIPLGVSVTALAADRSANRLAIGTVEGKVLVRQRGPSMTSRKRTRDPPAGTYAFFQRGVNANPVSGDYVVQDVAGKKRKLRKYDVALKQFRYGDALDEALATREPKIVVSVLEELGRRRGLTIALSNRDEDSLEPVLAFTAKCIVRPRFAAVLIGVADKLLEIYGPVTGQSEVIDELFTKLQEQVSHECKVQQSLLFLQGRVEALLAAAEDEEFYGA